MNAKRIKKIGKLIDQLAVIQDELSNIRDEEEEYRDNIPENLQESEQAWRSDTCIDDLDSALSTLEDTIDYLAQVE